MNRSDLADRAKKAGNTSALRTSLAAYFRTEKGKGDLADAPFGSSGKSMTADEAISALVEEARGMT